jgi:hypothetical protein
MNRTNEATHSDPFRNKDSNKSWQELGSTRGTSHDAFIGHNDSIELDTLENIQPLMLRDIEYTDPIDKLARLKRIL